MLALTTYQARRSSGLKLIVDVIIVGRKQKVETRRKTLWCRINDDVDARFVERISLNEQFAKRTLRTVLARWTIWLSLDSLNAEERSDSSLGSGITRC